VSPPNVAMKETLALYVKFWVIITTAVNPYPTNVENKVSS